MSQTSEFKLSLSQGKGVKFDFGIGDCMGLYMRLKQGNVSKNVIGLKDTKTQQMVLKPLVIRKITYVLVHPTQHGLAHPVQCGFKMFKAIKH